MKNSPQQGHESPTGGGTKQEKSHTTNFDEGPERLKTSQIVLTRPDTAQMPPLRNFEHSPTKLDPRRMGLIESDLRLKTSRFITIAQINRSTANSTNKTLESPKENPKEKINKAATNLKFLTLSPYRTDRSPKDLKALEDYQEVRRLIDLYKSLHKDEPPEVPQGIQTGPILKALKYIFNELRLVQYFFEETTNSSQEEMLLHLSKLISTTSEQNPEKICQTIPNLKIHSIDAMTAILNLVRQIGKRLVYIPPEIEAELNGLQTDIENETLDDREWEKLQVFIGEKVYCLALNCQSGEPNKIKEFKLISYNLT